MQKFRVSHSVFSANKYGLYAPDRSIRVTVNAPGFGLYTKSGSWRAVVNTAGWGFYDRTGAIRLNTDGRRDGSTFVRFIQPPVNTTQFLSGTINLSQEFTGHLTLDHNMVGNLDLTGIFEGHIFPPIKMVGNLDLPAAFEAALEQTHALGGTLPMPMVLSSPGLAVSKFLSGTLPMPMSGSGLLSSPVQFEPGFLSQDFFALSNQISVTFEDIDLGPEDPTRYFALAVGGGTTWGGWNVTFGGQTFSNLSGANPNPAIPAWSTGGQSHAFMYLLHVPTGTISDLTVTTTDGSARIHTAFYALWRITGKAVVSVIDATGQSVGASTPGLQNPSDTLTTAASDGFVVAAAYDTTNVSTYTPSNLTQRWVVSGSSPSRWGGDMIPDGSTETIGLSRNTGTNARFVAMSLQGTDS